MKTIIKNKRQSPSSYGKKSSHVRIRDDCVVDLSLADRTRVVMVSLSLSLSHSVFWTYKFGLQSVNLLNCSVFISVNRTFFLLFFFSILFFSLNLSLLRRAGLFSKGFSNFKLLGPRLYGYWREPTVAQHGPIRYDVRLIKSQYVHR